MDRVEIVEVGPRDGLQNISEFVPTETKVALIRALIAAGFKRLEVGSFVSPKAIPQMRDMDAVAEAVKPIAGAQARDVRGMVLVPNSKGARRAISAGYMDLELVISMSDAHNMSNVKRPTADSIADLKVLLEEIDPAHELTLRVGMSTSFHCPFEGLLKEAKVLSILETLVGLRERMEFAISDTTGMALPMHVKSLCGQALANFGGQATFAFHGHDTAGFGVANVLAAMEAGIRTIDASVGGLGGCPYAPGASGNVSSEDLVYLFKRMGVETGIDLELLLDAGDIAAVLPGAVTGSHVRKMPRETIVGARCDALALSA